MKREFWKLFFVTRDLKVLRDSSRDVIRNCTGAEREDYSWNAKRFYELHADSIVIDGIQQLVKVAIPLGWTGLIDRKMPFFSRSVWHNGNSPRVLSILPRENEVC